MHLSPIWCQVAAFGVYFLYGSYFEWFFHRYLFHSPKYIYRTFREHTLVHHQIYKGDDTYWLPEDQEPEKVAMDWWALPAMIGFHLPFMWLIQTLTHIPSMIGGALAIATYYTLYESLHWVMHVPRASRFLSNFAFYRFIDKHHHVHHKYMLSNLNVILPLADLTLGTLRNADGQKVRLFRRTPKTPNPATTPKTTTKTENAVSLVK